MSSTSHKRKRSDTIDDLEVDDGIVLIISEDEARDYLHILDDTIELSNGDKYDGELCDGIPHGHGTMTFSNGTKYVGEWVANQRVGHGTFTDSDGRIYTGEWKDDKPHGTGSFTYDHGAVYDGEWVANQRVGHGTFTYPDGRIYDGEWKDDKRHGIGTFTYRNGEVFVGCWTNGKKHGEGTITYDGTVYNSYWIDGQEVIEDDDGDDDDDDDEEDGEDVNMNIGASEEQISNATEVGLYGQIENRRNYDKCGIRLESFQNGDNVMRIAHCGHMFFQQELTNWLQQKGTCPECRHNICLPPSED